MKYYSILLKLLCAFILVGMATGSCRNSPGETAKPNVLLIICDDLNDSVEGMGGHPQARTPHLAGLARQGIRFTNAHSADPICGPSRASFLTGIYPHHSGLFGYNQNQNAWHNNPVLKHCKPIFEYFADNGYLIFGAGKLFHNNHHTEALFKRADNTGDFGPGMEYGPFAWTGNLSDNIYNDLVAHPDIPEKFGRSGFLSFASLDRIPCVPPDQEKGIPGYSGWYLADYPQGKPFRYNSEDDRDLMPDEITADYAIKKLGEDHEKPFFLAVGIIRPHSPWHAPKQYFDLFPLDEIVHPPYLENDLEDCAEELWYQPGWGKVHRFSNLLESYEGDEGWRRFIQAYLACVAFADAQIGRIIQALDSSRYAGNTIVVVTSDHGYHMGEKDQLFKRTVWEESTRVPLVFRLPGKRNSGLECNNPVGLIDIYPTLIDLCGISWNTMRDESGIPLDGHSLTPFLKDPLHGSWEGPDVALSCIEGGIPVALNEPGLVSDQQFTVRSRDWRYVLTRSGGEELYDHRSDPNEWHNLAGNPEYAEIKDVMKKQLLHMTTGSDETLMPKQGNK
jgi:arylsulfatase A-like enzyme